LLAAGGWLLGFGDWDLVLFICHSSFAIALSTSALPATIFESAQPAIQAQNTA
jgi:hypothetical protein